MKQPRLNPRGLLFVLSVLLVAASGAGSAFGQASDLSGLIEQVERLKRDLQTLQRAVYRGDPPPPTPAPSASPTTPARLTAGTGGGDAATRRLASYELRLTALDTELRTLTGRVEEVGHAVDLVGQRLDKLLRDVEFRLSKLEAGAAPGAVGSAPAATGSAATVAGAPTPRPARPTVPVQRLSGTGSGTGSTGSTGSTGGAVATLPAGDPLERYNYAMSLLRQRSYDEAEAAFRAFLADHDEDRLAGNAQYWLGETYYVRDRLDEAARTFLDGYQRYPDSIKAPDMLLKLAIVLRRLEQKTEACNTLAELRQRYPNVSDALRRRLKRERAGAGCG